MLSLVRRIVSISDIWRQIGSLVPVANPRQVWLITGAHGVTEFYSVALPPILPFLVADLHISYAQAGVLLTVFYAMFSIFQLPAGYLSDRISQINLLGAGMVILAGGVFLAGIADDYLTLLLAQGLAGIGGSTYHPTGMSLISDIESGATEGKAMGIHGFGGVVGTAFAPALIGGLAIAFDWRLALMLGAVVGIVYAVVFWALFSSGTDVSSDTEASDSATSTDGQTDHDSQERADSDREISLFAVPLRWWVVGLFGANFLISLEVGGIRTFATAYLFARGESAVLANGAFVLLLGGGGLSSLGVGHLADRIDRTLLGSGALLASALVLVTTAFVPPHPVVFGVWFFLIGVLVYASVPAMNALTSAYSEREFSGSLFGVMLTASALGGAVGPLLIGVAAERFGMTVAFPLIAVAGVLGALVFSLLHWT